MLTQLAASAAKPRDTSYKLSDGGGLALLVKPGGTKLWRFRYHFAGKERMLALQAGWEAWKSLCEILGQGHAAAEQRRRAGEASLHRSWGY
jgi:hypothetical protein